MKKFLIGVIFIIPIVVVIALSVTGSIISLTTPVNPTEIVIKNSDNVEIARDEVIKIDSRNFDEFIIIDVLPSITQDKTIEFEVVEDAGDGQIELEQMGASNRYSIIPKKVGYTKLVINPKANVNVRKEVNFYVSSDSIENISIYNDKGEDAGDYCEITENTKFYVDIYPIEAVRDNNVQWTSSNPSVAKVSQNGLVSIEGIGLSRIMVIAVDKDGNTVSDYVDVNTGDALVKSTQVYVAEAVDSDWILANVVLNATIAEVEDNGDGTFTVSITEDDITTTIIVTTLVVEEEEWDIVDLPSIMYTRKGGYVVHARKLINGEELSDVVVECLNPEVLEYVKETDTLVPVAPGTATIKFTRGGEVKEKVVTIRENPIAFELELGAADQKLGIQLTRTWGLYWLDENNNFTTQYRFGLTDKRNTFDVEWSVNNADWADLTRVENSQDVIINFKEGAKGQSVVITATLKVDNILQERVKRSFTFNFRPQKNSVNIYTFEQAKWLNAHKFYNYVLQSDIKATERLDNITGSVYGNGFKWDASEAVNLDYNDGAIEYDFEDFVYRSREAAYKANYEQFVQEGNDSMNFEDIIVFNANSLDEVGNRGSGIRSNSLWSEKRSKFDDFPKDLPVNFRFVQVYNTLYGIEIGYHYNTLVEGCILGDNVDSSCFIYFYNENDRRFPETPNEIIFRNNVFKISQGPSILNASVADGVENINSHVNSAPNMRFEGFNDFYNWQTRDQFYGSVSGMIGKYVKTFIPSDSALGGAIDALLLPILNDVLEDVSEGDAVQDLYYKYAGEQYVSFGYMGLGALFQVDSDCIVVESPGLMKTDLPFRDSEGNPVGKMQRLETLIKSMHKDIGLTHVDTLCNPSIIVCTNFAGGEPEIQPGDPIPNSKELYEKLRGEVEISK